MAFVETATAPVAAMTQRSWGARLAHVRTFLIGLVVPALLLALWHFATTWHWTRLIPSPAETAAYMVDFVFGGIYDDNFSATAHIHLLASMQRVYGGFAPAAIVALTLGIVIGRVPMARRMLDPFLQVMRPIPVTAWLPLSMILFGLGSKSAFALVFLAPSTRFCSTRCSA